MLCAIIWKLSAMDLNWNDSSCSANKSELHSIVYHFISRRYSGSLSKHIYCRPAVPQAGPAVTPRALLTAHLSSSLALSTCPPGGHFKPHQRYVFPRKALMASALRLPEQHHEAERDGRACAVLQNAPRPGGCRANGRAMRHLVREAYVCQAVSTVFSGLSPFTALD
jgi:hypothetical protein